MDQGIVNMSVEEQIGKYIASQPEPKRGDMEALHGMILKIGRNVNYGSWTAKTRRARSFPILISVTGPTP
jgi:hypothetical protein